MREHLAQLDADQLRCAAEQLSHALSVLTEVKSEESTTAEMHTAFLSLLTTTEIKASALEIVAARMARYPTAVRASEFSDTSQARTSLLRLAFQISWAMGEKEQAVQWLRTHTGGEDCDERQILRFLLETRDYDFWMSTYEAIQLRSPCAVNGWEKTFEKAKADGKLPEWQVIGNF